ncbi:MAG: SRPBCC domain-containing protein [Chloroflexota bacterium]
MSVVQQPSDSDRVIVTAEYPQLSPARLFQCFVDPAVLALWWAPAGASDPRVGGAYHLWWERMQWHLRGTYREFMPGQRLVFSWKWDHEPEVPERTVAVDFAAGEDGQGAQLTLTHGFYTADDGEERTGHIDGWLYFLPLINGVDA